MELFCVLVGAQEVQGSIFSVDVNAGLSINGLKKTIKNEKKNDLEKIDADRLKLYLAKRDDAEWLSSTSDEVNALKKGDTSATQDLLVQELDPTLKINEVFESTLSARTIHVLVIFTDASLGGNKRSRADEWFYPKKRSRIYDGEPVGYFEMKEFPSMIREDSEYKKIMIRKSYRIIFDGLMNKSFVKCTKNTNCRIDKTIGCADCICCGNYVVTGNPGTGKSRLYLYFIWRIMQSDFNDVRFVINCDDVYHEYHFTTRVFERLTDTQVDDMKKSDNVLRLIDGTSNRMNGWNGVSIIFESSGLTSLNEFGKSKDTKWILPPWSLGELRTYNSILDDELSLKNDVLDKRFKHYGGNPRFVFATKAAVAKNAEDMEMAMASYDAVKVIDMAKRCEPVDEKNYSHFVFHMIPNLVNFQDYYHLEFASDYVAERIINTAEEDIFPKLWQFAQTHRGVPYVPYALMK